MADDFEKAVLFSFDQSGAVDVGLKVRAFRTRSGIVCQYAILSKEVIGVFYRKYRQSDTLQINKCLEQK